MKTFFILFILTFFVGQAARAYYCENSLTALFGQQEKTYFKIKPDRVVQYRYLKGDGRKPTLVLLPGIFSGIPDDYEILGRLKKSGFGILTFSTSLHWQSLGGMDVLATPHFEKNSHVTLNSLAKEVVTLVEGLGIKNPVALSLSYSSAITSLLPYAKIQVAPMVKPSEADPLAAELMGFFEKGSAAQIRIVRDLSYQNSWATHVTTELMQNPLAYGGRYPFRVINGYAALSRAVEGFDLSQSDFSHKSSRQFIFAENESILRLKNQIQTFLQAAKHGASQMILVRHAEHNILFDQPGAYALAVHSLLENSKKMRVGVVNPRGRDKSVKWLSPEEISRLFNYILALPDSTAAADLSAVF